MTSVYLPLLTRIGFILLLLPAFPVVLSAQVRNTGIVTGRIVDSQNNAPVEYANIILRDTLSKKMVRGVVSDSTGAFRLTEVPSGTFFVEYTFIGYKKQVSKAVTVNKKNNRIDVGELRLAPAAITMDEVTITGERNMMINKIDRKVFNVQKDISAQTGTVTDVLQTIPSVSVDMDGNISLRGSGTVTILINGRPSVMAGMANLDQMPASMVERIEIITNPSAKYQPDGTAGIINIVLKKQRKAGFNGVLGANAGNRDRFNTNLQLNYNTGRVNLFGSYGFRYDNRLRNSELNSQTIDTVTDESIYLEQNTTGHAVPMSQLGRLGMDWEITDKDAAGISGTYNYRKVERADDTWSQYLNNEQVPSEEFTRTMTGTETEESAGLAAFYEHTFNREQEHLFRADFEYQGDVETEDDNYTTVYKFPVYPNGMDQTHGKNAERQLSLSLDYSRPLWKNASLETGYQGEMQLSDQKTDVLHWEPAGWMTDTSLGSSFSGNQTIHALYATLSYTVKNFAVMGGLRAEETLLYLDFISTDTTSNENYFAIYPTLHMSLSHGDNEWQLNYSRRVNRPDVEDLNPAPEFRDPRNIFVGNPNLKPEDIHSFETGYSLHKDNLGLVPTLFYRYKVNGFTWVTSNLNDTVLVTTMKNLDKDQSAGLDLSGQWSIAKIANLNFSASGFYSQIDASSIGYSSNKSTFSWNTKLYASVSITKTTLFQVNGQFRSKSLTAQGMREPSWVVNLGLRQDLWKKKVSIIYTVSDIFNSQVFRNSVETPELVQHSTRKRDGRVMYLGFVYNFGSNGKKTKETKFEFDNGMEN
jgi:outer membrane receptor protein involved in Fe transport